MTDQPPPTEREGQDALEAAEMGEKPDRGHKADTLIDALDGSDSGSDTRAGSLRGGSASGSDDDPDSAAINARLAEEGREAAEAGPDEAEGSKRRFDDEGGDPAEEAAGED